ncbi:PAS domain-containing sensor histidine kinase [Larkinella humicola]|uniref:histidine kinase n=1 Tax=Larkinella humicola TaxID=2607654 RepID=A0A5N1J6I3_9BACT|nr:PAS domain-containing sensor histidine kinase [Larkinella humicola]KAA9346324.1 PAS domain-containing sensor histidine kinase [Larkinella humicola]
MSENRTRSVNFLSGGGEMGALTRAFDWENSPLGNPDVWPQSLLTTVSLLLSSKFPMVLYWGDELIQFYNDAFRPSLGNLGKHPGALGQRGQDCWPEIWPVIKPLIDQVLAGGESTRSENQLLPIYRNGQIENVYWTFGYSPVLTDSSQIGGILVVCQETTQLVIAQQKIRQSEERFRTLFEQAPLGIALLSGRNMVINVVNEAMHEIWQERFSVVGMELIQFQPELKGQGFIELLETVYDTGVPYFGSGERVRIKRNGTFQEAYFNYTYTPLRDESDTIIGVMILAAEVTSQKENELILQQSLQREQELNQLKSRFVSIASHEFRTPLTVIQSSTDLIKLYLVKPPDIATPAIVKYTGVIAKQIGHLNELMTDLLTMGTVEAGKIAFHPRWTDAVMVCQHIIDRYFSNRVDGRVVDFSVEGEPSNTFLDEKLMSHVLVNLLSNAFKFAPDNPQLVLRFTSETVMIQVIDTGIGIPASDLSSLFQPFFRAGNTTSIQGTGLGLVIARQFVELHGGTLSVQSDEGLGTTFTIVLPNSPVDSLNLN